MSTQQGKKIASKLADGLLNESVIECLQGTDTIEDLWENVRSTLRHKISTIDAKYGPEMVVEVLIHLARPHIVARVAQEILREV